MNGMIDAVIQGIPQHRVALGIVIPVAGAMLGGAAQIWAPRGRAKGLITGAYMLLASLGVSSLIFALIAGIEGATSGQIAPLVLIGIVLTVIMGGFTPRVIREYQLFEGRKLAAQLFRRS